MRRRALLALPLVVTGLAGCSQLQPASAELDLAIFNQTDTPYTVELSIYEAIDGGDRSEARLFAERIDVAADGNAEREDVAESQQMIVHYDVFEENSKLTDQDHVHYYPPDGGDHDIAFDLGEPGVLTRR